MRTKIVYIVVSGEKDCYWEQMMASSWSLKRYNPTAWVTVLTCVGARTTDVEWVDEVKVVDVPDEFDGVEKSRWIKTQMRKFVGGDFLFVDTDTVVCGDLSGVDDLNCSVGAVLDSHCHAKVLSDCDIFKIMYTGRLKEVYGVDYEDRYDVFNSGVMYVKDDEKARLFFDRWHENWLKSRKCGYHVDQMPLLMTNIEQTGVLHEISGEYNCQIRVSVEYLTRAKILHTFASQGQSGLSPICDNDIYYAIKAKCEITGDIKELLLHCKETFRSPSYLLDKSWLKLRFLPANLYLQEHMDSDKGFDKFTISVLNFLSRSFEFIRRHLYK